VFIDALAFAEELIESYGARVKPRLLDGAFQRQMDDRYREVEGRLP